MKTDTVIFNEKLTKNKHSIGVITLNEPQSLNALSLEMIEKIHKQLLIWNKLSHIACVVLEGSGNKAFCAGGDIRHLYKSILATDYGKNVYAEAFFSKEYRLDYLIHKYQKPILCMGKGFIMGGGMGLFNGASHRLVTDSTIMSMPEIKIGLFPDAGGTYFLSKTPGQLGSFIGLLGVRIKPQDAIFAGLANYYLPQSIFDLLHEKLIDLQWSEDIASNHKLLSVLLKSINTMDEKFLPVSQFEKHYEQINAIMTDASPQEILVRLKQVGTEWFDKCAKFLETGCPASAHIVLEQLKRAKNMTLEKMFKMEFNIAIQCTRNKNFAEGIRALLIEKDNQPRWEDANLSSVNQDKINSFFMPDPGWNTHPMDHLAHMLENFS